MTADIAEGIVLATDQQGLHSVKQNLTRDIWHMLQSKRDNFGQNFFGHVDRMADVDAA